MMKRTAAQIRLNSMVQGKRKGALSSTSWKKMQVLDSRAISSQAAKVVGNMQRLSYLVKNRSHPTLQLSDDQAVCIPDVHQVVKLIV